MLCFFMQAYAAVFLVIGLINAALLLKRKRCWFHFYELFSCLILTFGTAACCVPFLFNASPRLLSVLPLPIIAAEIYLSISGKALEMTAKTVPEFRERSRKEQEKTVLASLIFSAPAYLSCLLFFFDKFFNL